MQMEITSPGGKRVNASYKGFTIETDQSEKYGGEGKAPEPFDLFLASIGTCAGHYVLSFCQERGIPAEGLKLIQRKEIDTVKKRISKLTLEIQLPPGFPEKYKETWK